MKMQDDKTIQEIVKRILLTEPRFQHANMIYQSCWRFWEVSANGGRPLSALSPQAFIDFNVKLGTVESIIRARRKVLKELGNKDLGRYSMAQKHYQSYLKKSL